MKLDKEQSCLDRLGIVINNEVKLQFYLEQIYASNCFDKTEMVSWENKPIVIKDDYDQAKLYFENLVRDFETYTQNSGSGAAKTGYESANQMADMGNEIRKYIQEIASATDADKERMAELAANISDATKAKDAQIESITTQIKLLTNTVAQLSQSIVNKENNGRGRGGRGSRGGRGGGGNGGGGSGSVNHGSSGTLATWAATAGPTAITPSTPSTTAPSKMQLRQPIAWAATISGQLPTGSGPPNKSTPATKESLHTTDRDRGWTTHAEMIMT
jgi:hypothetical protein